MKRSSVVLFFVVACGSPVVQPVPDAGAVDAGAVDAGVVDAGIADAGIADAGIADAGIADAGIADAGIADAGIADAGIADAGIVDAGAVDAGAVDAGSVDAGAGDGGSMVYDGGHGQVVGLCGRVAPELVLPLPSHFEVHFDFGADGYDDPQERATLTAGAQQILMSSSGFSSDISQAFAFESLALCEGASLLKTKAQIVYMSPTGKKADMLVSVAGQRVGVTVTRAVAFPFGSPYTVSAAETILTNKLGDILLSSMDVTPADRWVKQVLVVMAYDAMAADSVRTAWATIDPALRSDTIVYVVITDGDDASLY